MSRCKVRPPANMALAVEVLLFVAFCLGPLSPASIERALAQPQASCPARMPADGPPWFTDPQIKDLADWMP
jgi:hypothetical protein